MENIDNICDFIISEGSYVTPMKLIKMAYISHGHHLSALNSPLFSENVIAWEYGPVVRSIYYKYKKHQNNPINTDCACLINSESMDVVRIVLNNYDSYNGLELSALTHQKDTPWHQTIQKFGVNGLIEDQLIKEYYDKFTHKEQ